MQGAMRDGVVAGYNVLYRYSVWEAKTSCVVAAVCGTCAVCRVPHTSDISHIPGIMAPTRVVNC